MVCIMWFHQLFSNLKVVAAKQKLVIIFYLLLIEWNLLEAIRKMDPIY